MGENMVHLRKILEALISLDGTGKSHAAQFVEEAIDKLNCACEEMDGIEVKGKSNLDKLLGCMLGVEMIIGKEPDDGR